MESQLPIETSEPPPEPAGRCWPRRAELTVALALTVAAIALHVRFFTHAGPLWRDEVNSVRTVMAPSLSTMMRQMESDLMPLLWRLLLRAWMAMGEWAASLEGLRALGLLTGLALLAALWVHARLMRLPAPTLSLALAALSPAVVPHVAGLRAYGAASVAAVLLVALVWWFSRRPSPGRGLLVAAAALALVHTVYFGAIFCAAAAAGAMAVDWRRRTWCCSAALVGIGVGAALSLLIYAELIRNARRWHIVYQLDDAGITWYFRGLLDSIGSGNALLLGLWLASAMLALAALVRRWPHRAAGGELPQEGDRCLYAATVLAVALAGQAAFLMSSKFPAHPRYYVALLAVMAVCLDSLAASLPWRKTWTSAARLAAALPVAAVSFALAWPVTGARMTNMDLIAQRLEQEAAPDDLVVVMPFYLGVSLRWHYHGPAAVTGVPPIDMDVHRFDQLLEAMRQPEPLAPLLARVEQTLRSGHRVWIVRYGPMLPAGRQPVVLAPAPDPKYGWSNAAYTSAWRTQVDDTINRRAVHGRILGTLHGGPLSGHETPGLVVVWGWREQARPEPGD